MNSPLPKTDHQALRAALDDMKTILEEHQRFKEALQIIEAPLPSKISPRDIASHALKGWPFPNDNLQSQSEKGIYCEYCKHPIVRISAETGSYWKCSYCEKESQKESQNLDSINNLVSSLLTDRSYIEVSDTGYIGQHGTSGHVRIRYVHRDKPSTFVVGENFTDAVQKLVQKLKD